MKRTLFLILMAITFTNAFSQERFTIICDSWPPYQIEEDGFVTGFSTEVVRAVLDKLKQPYETIVSYPWKRALTMIETNNAHGLFSANYTEDRTKFAWYPSESLIDSPWVIFGKKNSTYTGFESLKGKRIGTVRGYSYTAEFLNYINENCIVDEASDDETNFLKLDKGRIDFTVGDYGNGITIIKSAKYQDIKGFTDNPIKKDGLFLIFNKTKVNKEFVDKFSETLKDFKQTNMYKSLYNKYFSL
ncbi:MAG: transporter substrate-binding domain-containing protein [Spirochaetales bacterium]|nr:transporter substrate-binding domain-containing protein [Spirochaetales bacterium]